MDFLELVLSFAIAVTFSSCEKTSGSVLSFRKSMSFVDIENVSRAVGDVVLSRAFFFFPIFDCSRFIYPGLVSLFITTLYFPGFGKFLAPELSTRVQIIELFSNFTWVSDDLSTMQKDIVDHWAYIGDTSSIFVNLSIFMVITVSLKRQRHNLLLIY